MQSNDVTVVVHPVAAAGCEVGWYRRRAQAGVVNALDGTDVPHCSVKWSGDDPKWFGSPYFIVPWLEGDVMRIGPDDWGHQLSAEQHLSFGRQAMTALAGLHKIDIAVLTQ